MLSYHSDPAIKASFLARVEGHFAVDEVIKGQYWQAGKGCAVGCTRPRLPPMVTMSAGYATLSEELLEPIKAA